MGLQSLLNPFKHARGAAGGGLTKLGEVLSTNVSASLGLGNSLGMPIAVDFGTGSLKVLQLAGIDPPTLHAAAALETPQALIPDHRRRLEFQLDALPKLIKMGGFKGRRAVCSIPAWQTTCKHLQFPRQDGVPLASLVEAAIPQQLGVDASSLVYRFIEVSNVERNGNKVDVVLITVQRDVVNAFMQSLVAAKLEPVGLHSEFLCAVKAFEHLTRREDDTVANTLWLDLGATTSKVMITHGRSLVFARMINVGGNDLDSSIAKQFNIDEVTARTMRLEMDQKTERVELPPEEHKSRAADTEHERRRFDTAPGFSGEVSRQPSVSVGPDGANLAEPLEIITDEVRLCLRYHSSQFPGKRIDRIVFVGGESRHRGLVQHIARVLRLPAQVADPLARIARTGTEPMLGVDFKNPQPGWAVALGLCLAPTDL